MDVDQLYTWYLELRHNVGWNHSDAERLQAVRSMLEPHFATVIDEFCSERALQADTRKLITGGEEQIGRLKATLHDWLLGLLSGPYDAEFITGRFQVVSRHAEIELELVYVAAALSRIRTALTQALVESWAGGAALLWETIASLNKLLDLDLAIIEDAYQAECTTRQQRGERLAAIGQAMAGLAHESRNTLQRSQASLEMLARRVNDRPEAVKLITRIQKAQDDLHRLYEEVREYAAPIRLSFEPCHLRKLLEEAWRHLERMRDERTVHFRLDAERLDLCCEVDRFAICQVFRNTLENALAACEDPVEIEVCFSEAQLGGRPAVCVAIGDNGPGLTHEEKRRIFEEFFTTKTHGTGLGMAIVKRLVDAHAGLVEAGSNSRRGAEIRITFPRKQT